MWWFPTTVTRNYGSNGLHIKELWRYDSLTISSFAIVCGWKIIALIWVSSLKACSPPKVRACTDSVTVPGFCYESERNWYTWKEFRDQPKSGKPAWRGTLRDVTLTDARYTWSNLHGGCLNPKSASSRRWCVVGTFTKMRLGCYVSTYLHIYTTWMPELVKVLVVKSQTSRTCQNYLKWI